MTTDAMMTRDDVQAADDRDDNIAILALLLEYSQYPHVTDDRILAETLAMHLLYCREVLGETMQENRENAETVARLRAELARCEGALAWYADETNYMLIEDTGQEIPGHWLGGEWSDELRDSQWVSDGGRRAREALDTTPADVRERE